MGWIILAIHMIGYIVAFWWQIQKLRREQDVRVGDLAAITIFSLFAWVYLVILVMEYVFNNPKVVFRKKEYKTKNDKGLRGQDTKIYIDIRDGISPVVALKCVESVVEDDESYFPTEFDTAEDKVWVSTCLYHNHECL